MKTPDDAQWARVEELADELGQLDPEFLPARLAQLAAQGEAPTVLTMLGTWLRLPAPAAQLQAGTVLGGRYVLRQKLGEGAMGSVWRASQERVSRDVAIKLIHPSLVTPALKERFAIEIKVLGQLNHPGIVKIFDADVHSHDGVSVPFFAMELIEGEPLDRWAASRRSQPIEILRVISEICHALGSAHERQIVHRDLKPGNILVRSDNQPVIVDFGVARLRGLVLGDEQGAFSGTPQYAAPEQHLGRDHDFRSGESVDIYAVGVILFEVLSGRKPFEFPRRTSVAEMRRTILESAVPRLSQVVADCPSDLEEIVSRALRREPVDRFYSIAAMGRALDRVASRISAPAAPVSPWVPVTGAVIPRTNWTLVERIGEGGAGEVWIGVHTELGERRVFKFCDSEEKARTLKREMTLFRLLKERVGRNPHFITLHEVSLDEPPYYLMMEHVPARDLESWGATRPGGLKALPESTRLEIIIQVAEGLEAAHEAGILHRDIKPANLLVREDPALHVYVADFGIGQLVTDQVLSGRTRQGFTRTVSNIRTATLSGTLLYLAPEVLEGSAATVRSDIYSLGVILWQLLSGNLHAALDPSDWPACIEDPILRDILRRCLAGSPEKRWASAAELAASLRSLPEQRAAEERRAAELKARERAAYRRGLLRASFAGLSVIALLSALVVYAFKMRNRERVAHAGTLLQEALTLESSLAPDAPSRALKLLADAAPIAAPTQIESLRNSAIFHLCRPGAHDSRIGKEIVKTGAIPNFDCSQFCSVTPEGTVTVWRITDAGPLKEWTTVRLPEGQWNLSLSPSGLIVAAFREGRPLHITSREEHIWRPFPEPGNVLRVNWTDADDLIAATPRGLTQIAARQAPFEIATLESPPPGLEERLAKRQLPSLLATYPTARWLATAEQGAQSVKLYSLERGGPAQPLFHPRPVTAFSWKRSQEELACAVGCEGGAVYIWPILADSNGETITRTESVLRPFGQGPQPAVKSLAWRADGELLAVLHADSVVRLWEHSWKNGLWSISGAFTLPEDSKEIFFEKSGHMIVRSEQGGLAFARQYDEPIFREQSFDHFPWESLSTAFGGEVAVGATSRALWVFDPISFRILGRQPGAFVTRAEVDPVTRALIYSDREGVEHLSWSGEQNGKWLQPGTRLVEDQLDFRLCSEPAPGLIIVRTPEGLTARPLQEDSPAVPIALKGINHWDVAANGLWIAGDWESKTGTDLFSLQIPSSSAASTSGIAVRQIETLSTNRCLSLEFAPDSRALAFVHSAGIEWHPLQENGKPLQFAHERTRTESPAPITIDRKGDLIAAINSSGNPILLGTRTTGSELLFLCALPRRSGRTISTLAFTGSNDQILLAGSEDGVIEAWHLDEIGKELAALGLTWNLPAFPPVKKPEPVAAWRPLLNEEDAVSGK